VKTTLHFQRVPGWASSTLADWGSVWAKIVNPSPGTNLGTPRLLVRHWTDDRDADYLRDGRAGGARFVADMASAWARTPATAYELANEPDVNSNEGLAALNAYTIGAIEEAERRGLKLCVLNIAEGNPHDNDTGDDEVVRWKWAQLAPAVERAIWGGHFVGLHSYWRPGIEGPMGRYHALGRRAWDIGVLNRLGLDVTRLKVLINETGIDGGIADGPAQRGWRDLSHPDAYRAEIAEAERFARTIPQVQALMFFTAGYEPPWAGFDIDEWFARSCTGALRAVGEQDGYVIPAKPEEGDTMDITAEQLKQARERLAVFPASMKVCHDLELDWCAEWRDGDAVLVLAHDDWGYRVLRLNPRTWEMEAEKVL